MSTETRPEGGVPPITAERYVATQQSEEFGRLRSSFRSFVFPMTVAFLTWYLLYVVLSAFARGFMSTTLFGNINVALVFGLLQFVTTFGIAVLYSRYADRRLDPTADRIRTELEGEVEGAGAPGRRGARNRSRRGERR